MTTPLILAHRGFSGNFPENSRRGFLEAINVKGCHGFETDLQMSSDGELVIIHDETLERTTTGTGYVNATTFKDLRKLDIGSWKGPQFAGEAIMALDELLELAIQHNKKINLELKNYLIYYPNMEEKVIERICAFKAEDKVFLSSFNHVSMEKARSINPNIPTGLLYHQPLINVEKYATGHALHPHHLLLQHDPGLVTRAHKEGLKIHTWTVNKDSDMRTLIKMKVDSIITDYPNKLAKILEEKE